MPKMIRLRTVLWLFGAGMMLAIVLLAFLGRKEPVALLRVVDASGKPVAGASLKPEGLRTKPGPYQGGGYGWPFREVTNAVVLTDTQGYARIPYPQFVFEKIETGVVIVTVDHPDYVPAQSECVVTDKLPAGAPWREKLADLRTRLLRRALLARTAPIVVQKGSILRITGRSARGPGRLLAQVSGVNDGLSNFWATVSPDVLVTRRLGVGLHTVRAVQLNPGGDLEFSDVVTVLAVAGQTNELFLDLKPALAVRGRVDASVPRPVIEGRVIAQVWPLGHQARTSPPLWHTWAPLQNDGSFTMTNLPPGDLEVVAVCEGHVSTNGPGQFPSMHYPQRHVLATNDLEILIGMEPTGAVEMKVLDDQGRALSNAVVEAWPNVRYGEWSATILGEDCYHTADAFRTMPPNWWLSRVTRYRGTTDAAGLVVVRHLTPEVKIMSVEHPKFVLPAVNAMNGRSRQAAVTVTPAATNRISVTLEPAGQAPIRHY